MNHLPTFLHLKMLKLKVLKTILSKSFLHLLVLIAFNIRLCYIPNEIYVTAKSDQCKTIINLAGAPPFYSARDQCDIAIPNIPNNKIPTGYKYEQISLLLPQVNTSIFHYSNVMELNNTRFANKKILFFNRVTKVGSTTLVKLINRLAKLNSFGIKRNIFYNLFYNKLNYEEQHEITTWINKLSPPNAYSMHTPFINFTRHGYQMPIYINMVRDPVERAISAFHFIRTANFWSNKGNRPQPTTDWLNKDFETCVLKGDAECLFITGEIYRLKSQALFYCGHNTKCFEWAIQTAKENVERSYSVVGVLEEMDLTLAVLEKYIPRFFANATRVYSESKTRFRNIMRNFKKPKISEEIKNILRQNFTCEIEFYEFCKQRLHKQAAVLLNTKDL